MIQFGTRYPESGEIVPVSEELYQIAGFPLGWAEDDEAWCVMSCVDVVKVCYHVFY